MKKKNAQLQDPAKVYERNFYKFLYSHACFSKYSPCINLSATFYVGNRTV